MQYDFACVKLENMHSNEPLCAETTKQGHKGVKVNMVVASRKGGSHWKVLWGGALVIEWWLPNCWFYNITYTIQVIYIFFYICNVSHTQKYKE